VHALYDIERSPAGSLGRSRRPAVKPFITTIRLLFMGLVAARLWWRLAAL